MEENTSTTKHIKIGVKNEKKNNTTLTEPSKQKTSRKKIVSQTEQWINTANRYSTQESQLSLLINLISTKNTENATNTKFVSNYGNVISDDRLINKNIELNTYTVDNLSSNVDVNITESANILWTHLKTKHFGYKSQDTIKTIYEPDKFVQITDIIGLLIDSNLSCFYCKRWTKLFYDKVRDNSQWSLERISNTEGHNRNNVVIACLECNMRRRTMYHERYIATKQLKVNKLGGDDYEYDEIEKSI